MENPQAKSDFSQQNIHFQRDEVQSISHAERQFKLPYSVVQHIKKQSRSQIPRFQQSTSSQIKDKRSFLGNAFSNWKDKKNKIIAVQNCAICQLQFASKEMHSVGKQCNHKFCFSCLASYSAYKINIFQLVECPEQKCHATLQKKSKIYQTLDDKMKRKYQQIVKYQQVKKDPNLHLCPQQNCNGIVSLISENDRIICQTCQGQFCKKCLMKFHIGNCDSHQILFFQAGLSFRQCKNCKRVVQRVSGCNHITCKCSFEFCYQCGKKWEKNHNCFNIPECFIDYPKLRLFCKILYVIFFTLIIYPLRLLMIFAILISLILITLIIGIFVQPFVVMAQLLEQGVQYLILGIVLLPFLLIYGIIRAAKQLFEQSCGVIITIQELTSPCILTKALFQQCCRQSQQ